MANFGDVTHPHKRKPAFDEYGNLLHEDTLSGGELAFARIAKVIVEEGWRLDEACIAALNRLFRT